MPVRELPVHPESGWAANTAMHAGSARVVHGHSQVPHASRGVHMLPIRRSLRLLRALLPAASLLCLSVSPVAAQRGDIPTVARSAGQFATLITALEAAGLTSTLRGNGPYTVFAPTDEAFRKLPAGTVENLLKPENKEQLVAVLTYHVVPGKVMAADVGGLTSAPTVNGKALKVDTRSGVKIDNATVTATDIAASNGVIHVIDTVVLP